MASKKLVPTYGPAMLALSLAHRKFVIALFDRPGIAATKALWLSGYTGNEEACKKQSYRLMHNPDVMAAIREYAATADTHQLPAATGAYRDILTDPKHRDRLTAAKHVMERAGLGPARETHVTVTHTLDRADLLAKIAGLIERNTPVLITNGSTVTVTAESEAEQSSFVAKGEAPETE